MQLSQTMPVTKNFAVHFSTLLGFTTTRKHFEKVVLKGIGYIPKERKIKYNMETQYKKTLTLHKT